MLSANERLLLFGLLGSQIFWYLALGIPTRGALIAVVVVATSCWWGYITIQLLGNQVIGEHERPLWFLGPSLPLGLFVLFAIRLMVPGQIFLLIAFLVPFIWAIGLRFASHPKLATTLNSDSAGLRLVVGSVTLFVGLVGTHFVRNWLSLAPIIVCAGLSALFIASQRRMWQLIGLAQAVVVIVLGATSNSGRSTLWWASAEGIPFDETILESISNGLIEWGPSTNPIHYGLSGLSSIAYHHLLYLLIGLINRISGIRPYEALSLIGPVTISMSIVASVVLLARTFLKKSVSTLIFPTTLTLALFAFQLGLDGEGFGSPSSRFGITAILGSIALLIRVQETEVGLRHYVLTVATVVTVAFSKGPFIFAPVVVSVFLAINAGRYSKKIAATSLMTMLVVILSFSRIDTQADTYFVEFWPSAKMGGAFDLSFYSLRVLFDLLLKPIILGFTCIIVVLVLNLDSKVRTFTLALGALLSAGVISQLVVSSTGPRSFELLYVPAVLASSLLLVILAASLEPDFKCSIRMKIVVLCTAVALSTFAPSLNRPLVTPMTLAALVVGTFTIWTKFPPRLRPGVRQPFEYRRTEGLFILLSAVVIVNFIINETNDKSSSTTLNDSSVESQWFGSKTFNEISTFIQEFTPASDLFAYSLCTPSATEECEVDYRPSALMRRKFLALDPSSIVSARNDIVSSDIELSRSVGLMNPDELAIALHARGVAYVVIDRSRVSDNWILKANRNGFDQLFSNADYALLKVVIHKSRQ